MWNWALDFLRKRSPKSSMKVNMILVMGSHGHTFFKDLIFGTTVDSVRHRVNIPVFIP